MNESFVWNRIAGTGLEGACCVTDSPWIGRALDGAGFMRRSALEWVRLSGSSPLQPRRGNARGG
jgi:hypothetical protein